MADVALCEVGAVEFSSSAHSSDAGELPASTGPQTVVNSYYLMEGQTDLAPSVTWVTTAPDMTGASYTGPGTLVLATIHVGARWG